MASDKDALQRAKGKLVKDMTPDELQAVISNAADKLKTHLESPEVAAALKQIDAELSKTYSCRAVGIVKPGRTHLARCVTYQCQHADKAEGDKHAKRLQRLRENRNFVVTCEED
jgi:hypothetical protein